jgi:hypothetical protein
MMPAIPTPATALTSPPARPQKTGSGGRIVGNLTGVTRGTIEFQGNQQGNQFAFSSLCCDGFEVFYERIC